ncbi:MAG: PorT family protein [Chitinophagales bacterium]|nr:PorT family protein [Chitinophagales bacterium]
MKKLLLFLMMMPLAAFSQWTPQQQEEYRKQMDQMRQQMDQQMKQLQDSLRQMEKAMNEIDWSAFDTSQFNINMPGIPPVPPVPPVPPSPGYTEPFPGGEVYTNDDTTEVRWGKWHVVVHEGDDGEDKVKVYKDENCCEDEYDHEDLKNIQTKFLLLDIGVNNYFGKGFDSHFPGYEPFEPNPGKSWVVNIHAFNQRLNLIDHHLWLSYGLFFEFNSYKYNSQQVLVADTNAVAFSTYDVTLKKNKLSTDYVGVPLMLRYESNPSHLGNSFHVSAGGFFEYMMGSRVKVKTTSNDKVKVHDDFNVNPIRYGLSFRAGYGFVNIYAMYGLSTFLKNDVEPVTYPFSAGLAFEF